MKLYHRTNAAEQILSEGFSDSASKSKHFQGVWLSEVELDANDGVACGDTVLMVDVPDKIAAKYELQNHEYVVSIYLIPADVLNQAGRPQIVSDDWAGQSRESILEYAASIEQFGKGTEAERLRARIPFLERQGLLVSSEECERYSHEAREHQSSAREVDENESH